jgi:iron complex outermembrane recepter protein
MRKSALLLGAAAPIALLVSMPAHAQTAPEEDTASTAGEIIVTARKRQEAAINVPVVETVLSAELLDRNQVTDVSGIVRQVPGLQIGQAVLTVGTQISLRGVGTSSLDAGLDQSISMNVDGLQLSQGATFGVGLFDMAQVEVLKGPQALFFGKNSPGGVISVRTADPGSEFEVIARASYEFYAREKRGELIVSAPFSDTLGFRFAGMYSESDGYFFNKAFALPGTGARDPSSDRYLGGYEYILRGTLLWEPTSDFSARLKVNHNMREVIGGGAALGSCPDGIASPVPGSIPPFINPNETCRVDRDVYIVDLDPTFFPDVRNNGTPFMRYNTWFGSLELNYGLPSGININSTTGYFDTVIDGFINGVNSGYAGPTLYADNHFERRDFTQEVRVESDWNKPLNFMIGGYFQDARVSNRIFVGANLAYLPPFLRTLAAGTNDIKIRTLSAFGQLRYAVTPQLELAGGVRFTDERRRNTTTRFFSYDGPDVPQPVLRPELHSSNWSPEFTITYKPTDDLTLFAAYKQGFKSGSYIMTLPPPIPGSPGACPLPGPCDNSFGPETAKGGEVGVKARVLDRALNLSLAGYYYHYSNLQVGANEVAQGSGGVNLPVIRTINAGTARVYGIDFEANYDPPAVEGLSLRLAVNWNNARFISFPNGQCIGGQTIADGCNTIPIPGAPPLPPPPGTETVNRFQGQNFAGQRLPKAADWQINAGFDYELPVGDGMKLRFGANGQYSSKFLRLLGYHREDFYQPAFFKLNANIALAGERDAWELALIGNNLTDKYTSGNCTNFSAATGQIFGSPVTGAPSRNVFGVDELACIPDRGREVFLRLTLRPTAF